MEKNLNIDVNYIKPNRQVSHKVILKITLVFFRVWFLWEPLTAFDSLQMLE